MMEQMTAIRKRSETSVIGQIADDLLAWVRSHQCVSIRKLINPMLVHVAKGTTVFSTQLFTNVIEASKNFHLFGYCSSAERKKKR